MLKSDVNNNLDHSKSAPPKSDLANKVGEKAKDEVVEHMEKVVDKVLPGKGEVVRKVLDENLVGRMEPWVENFVRWMDELIRIPGLKTKIGLDPILGFFFPALGDTAAGLSALGILMVSLRKGVPAVILMRMLLNIGMDTIFGSVPFLGDLYDMFFRSNRKNMDLMKQFQTTDGIKQAPRKRDYAILLAAMGLVVAMIALPIVMYAAFVLYIGNRFGGQ